MSRRARPEASSATISTAESGAINISWIEFMKRPWKIDDETSL